MPPPFSGLNQAVRDFIQENPNDPLARRGVGPLGQRTKRHVEERLEDAVHFSAHAYEALSDVRIGVSTKGVATCTAVQKPLDDLIISAQALVARIQAVLAELKKNPG